jgi:hypothetical protein
MFQPQQSGSGGDWVVGRGAGSTSVQDRSVLKNVYLWMTGGMGVTGAVALYVSGTEALVRAIASNPLLLIGLIVAEIGLVFYVSARIHKMSPTVAMAAFGVYSLLNGVTLSLVFLAYTGASIAKVFFIAGGMFAATSLWAMTTKRNLAGFGQYLYMGLIGIILASVVNIFLGSATLDWIISLVGVAVFVGLTAYDTQQIQHWSAEAGNSMSKADYTRLSIMGALKLYLDFINLFLFLLRLLGDRR